MGVELEPEVFVLQTDIVCGLDGLGMMLIAFAKPGSTPAELSTPGGRKTFMPSGVAFIQLGGITTSFPSVFRVKGASSLILPTTLGGSVITWLLTAVMAGGGATLKDPTTFTLGTGGGGGCGSGTGDILINTGGGRL